MSICKAFDKDKLASIPAFNGTSEKHLSSQVPLRNGLEYSFMYAQMCWLIRLFYVIASTACLGCDPYSFIESLFHQFRCSVSASTLAHLNANMIH